METIYLDHNATTPPLPEVLEAMARCEREAPANPASQHRAGRKARQRLEDAREGIAEILGVRLGTPGDQLIFTSGGTEANNLALFGLFEHAPRGDRPRTEDGVGASADRPTASANRLAITAIEHPSVAEAADELKRQGWPVAKLGVDSHGVLKLAEVETWLAGGTLGTASEASASQVIAEEEFTRYRGAPGQRPVWLLSVMLGNNETGVLQPVAEVVAAAKRQVEQWQEVAAQTAGPVMAPRVLIHTDAVQVVGKLPVKFTELGVDALTFSAHKFHGPKGIGGLIVHRGVDLRPRQFGGFQQGGKRPGTETVSLAVGMHVALEHWHREAEGRRRHLETLRNRLEAGLRAAGLNIVVHGAAAARLPHTSNVSFLGHNRQSLLMALDLAGVACSTGSACASGSSDPSPTLLAMGASEAAWESALRFSVGHFNTAPQVDEAVRRISIVVNNLEKQRRSPNLSYTARS